MPGSAAAASLASADPRTLSRDQLIERLQEAEHALTKLRGPLAASVGGAPTTATQSGRSYDVSFTVLVIENGDVSSVPLAQVLDKSYLREDQREADTPCGFNGSEGSVGRSSEHIGRFSVGGGGNMSDPESPDMRGRGSVHAFASPGASVTSPIGASPQPTGGIQRNVKVAPLKLALGRPQSLDADAIVSHQTLHEFNRQFGAAGGITSPLSSYAKGIFNYITQTFANKNGFEHDANDLEGLGRTLVSLCGEVEPILRSEPRHSTIPSPCYVFGDIHGNYRDLHYFMQNLVTFNDMRYTSHRFVFLGDYVDRGEFSVEVIAYLFAIKVLAPEKVLLLRGNHEDTLVSGDLGSYGATSFRAQCRKLFGAIVGEDLWRKASRAFAYLPLTANIDKKIFCTHGGLPRFRGGADNRLETLSRSDFPALESFFQVPERESQEQLQLRQAATDTCWSDPAEDDSTLDAFGFGPNPRGNGVILFGAKAVEQFLDRYGFEYIFRAHQEKSDGLKLSKSARVFTIFSTSAYVGHENGAGVVLVADGKIRLIIKNADKPNDSE
jgi:protein phosphatase